MFVSNSELNLSNALLTIVSNGSTCKCFWLISLITFDSISLLACVGGLPDLGSFSLWKGYYIKSMWWACSSSWVFWFGVLVSLWMTLVELLQGRYDMINIVNVYSQLIAELFRLIFIVCEFCIRSYVIKS